MLLISLQNCLLLKHLYLLRHLEEEIKKRDGFELVREGLPCTNVCFWYLPPALREEPRTVQWWQKLNKVSSNQFDKLRCFTFIL